jgi:hypothetical protein
MHTQWNLQLLVHVCSCTRVQLLASRMSLTPQSAAGEAGTVMFDSPAIWLADSVSWVESAYHGVVHCIWLQLIVILLPASGLCVYKYVLPGPAHVTSMKVRVALRSAVQGVQVSLHVVASCMGLAAVVPQQHAQLRAQQSRTSLGCWIDHRLQEAV